MARRKAAAEPAAKPKGRKRGGLALPILAALAVLALGALLLGSGAKVGRVDSASLPAVIIGMAAFAFVITLGRNASVWVRLSACALAIGLGIASVTSGAAPVIGRGLASAGAVVVGPRCPAPPAGRVMATSPAGRTCVPVKPCPDGKAPGWTAGDRPTGRCVRWPR